MPENVSIEDCIDYGIDAVFCAIRKGSFNGDLLGYISGELRSRYPSVDGITNKIARSLYWTLINETNPFIEVNSYVDIYSSTFSARCEYVIKRDDVDKEALVKNVVDKYKTYILS